MDLLYECAVSFEKLLHIQYHFVLGRKGNLKEFHLSFDKSDFHHLAGLHKLKDINALQIGKRSKIFDAILSQNITIKDIQKSEFYNQMYTRLEPLLNIEKFLDDNQLIFHYNEKNRLYSVIKADYLLENQYQNQSVYLFLGARTNENNQMCRTLFPKNVVDYTNGQPKYTLLKKEKLNMVTGDMEQKFNRMNS